MTKRADDTDIGGEGRGFPQTPPSALLATRSDDPIKRARGFAILIAAYWKPIYKCIRVRFGKNNEDAKDLTQDFFAHVLEQEIFQTFDAHRGRFRVFVRKCLRNFIINAERAKRRLKRGGGTITLNIDFEEAENELSTPLTTSEKSLEEDFDREFVKSLESMALKELQQQLKERDKEIYFELFERYDLHQEVHERPTYATLANEFGIKTTDVTNHLAYVRRTLRHIVLRKLREITVDEEEFREEARDILGLKESDLL